MASHHGGLLLLALLLCLAGHTPRSAQADEYGSVTVPITVPSSNTTFNYTGPNITDITIGILNGSIPIGRIQSLLFTQMNRFNMFTINSLNSRSNGYYSAASSKKKKKKPPPPKPVPQPSNGVAVGGDPNSIPPGATVSHYSGGGSGSGCNSNGCYSYSYYYDVDCHGDDEEEDEDDEEKISEPIARLRVQMYTSVSNLTFVRFRVKSKWLNNSRTVQIRKGAFGKTGPLVMTVPGSWRITKATKFRLSFQTLVVNATHAKTDTGKNLTKTIQEITKSPWNYYVVMTTKEQPNGVLRGQLWKPMCPFCNSTWWGMG